MSWLYACTIYPLQLFYKYVYLACIRMTGSYGLGLIGLSLCCAVAFVPLGRMAQNAKKREDLLQDMMQPQIDRIKAESTGAERQERIAKLYRRYGYHPLMSLRSAIGVLLQFPFLTAAYRMVSELTILKGQSFWFIKDLSLPDGLWGGVNALPIIMTLINFATVATAPNMRGKERVQAVVLALLFLWLLYGAPSALLVYWTCNNINYLVQNFVFRDKKNTLHVEREHHSFIAEEPDVFLSIFLGVATFCVFIPTSLYFANIDEFLVGFAEIVPVLLIASVFLTIILVLIMKVIRKSAAFRFFAALLFGMAVALFLQAHFLNPPLPVLNGAKINWEQYSKYSVLSTVVWSLCLMIPFIVEWKNAFLSRKIRKGMSLFLIALQIVFLVVAASTTTKTVNLDDWVITKKGEFELSKKKNTIVFIVDTLDTLFFETMILKDEQLCRKLKDFTYFNNIVAGGAPTYLGMPLLLTGKRYDCKSSPSVYYNEAYRESMLFSDLQREGCSVNLYTGALYLNGVNPAEVSNIAQGKTYHISSFSKFAFYLYRLVSFNSTPQVIKPYLEFYGDNLTSLVSAGNVAVFNVDDPLFYSEMHKNKLALTDIDGLFSLYHLRGAHPPFTMDENCKRISETSSFEAGRRQTKGAFRIVLDYIEYMKLLGVYDDCTFIITSDHGARQLWQNPAVLVKLPGTREKLAINDAPGTFVELRATIAASLLKKAEKYGKTLFDLTHDDNKERLHTAEMRVVGGVSLNDKRMNRRFNQFLIIGNGRNVNEQNTYIIPKAERTEFTKNQLTDYDLGKVLLFRRGAEKTKQSAKSFIVTGFSGEGKSYTWTDGKEAQIAFKLSNNTLGKDYLCVFEHGTFHKQRVVVKVNDEVYLEYAANGQQRKSFLIPGDKIKNGEIYISFLLPDAVSPLSRGQSFDSRLLALSMQSLCISEYHGHDDYVPFMQMSFKSSEGNTAKPYLQRGFSNAERDYTWTNGHEAQMAFRMPHDFGGKKLLCCFEHGTYAGKQHVIVKANGTIVLEYEATGQQKKELLIPAESLKDDILVLTFILPDAVSPKSRGKSADGRVLALSMQSMSMSLLE